MIRMISAFLLSMATVAPALAEQGFDPDGLCPEMWYARNAVMNRAGYCFDSALGQALFDNRDCTGKEVTLTAEQKWVVAYASRIEAEIPCEVDTTKTSLHLRNLTRRRPLFDFAPAREFGGFMCQGYQGPEGKVHLGHSANAPVVGRFRPGMDLVFNYDASAAPDGWDLIHVLQDNKTLSLGWAQVQFDAKNCDLVLP